MNKLKKEQLEVLEKIDTILKENNMSLEGQHIRIYDYNSKQEDEYLNSYNVSVHLGKTHRSGDSSAISQTKVVIKGVRWELNDNNKFEVDV